MISNPSSPTRPEVPCGTYILKKLVTDSLWSMTLTPCLCSHVRTKRFVAESLRPGSPKLLGLPTCVSGHLTLFLLHRHNGFTFSRSALCRRGRAFTTLQPTTMSSAEPPLRLSPSPFQAKDRVCPNEGRTPSPHNCHIYTISL